MNNDSQSRAWVQLASGTWIQLDVSQNAQLREAVASVPRTSEWLAAVQHVRNCLQRSAAYGHSKLELLAQLDLMACGASNQEDWLNFHVPMDWRRREDERRAAKT